VAEADIRARAIEDRLSEGLDAGRRQEFLRLLQHCVTALDVPSEERRQPTENRSTRPEKDVYDPWHGIACRSPAG
jgi:hypothetical protein